MFYIFLNNIGYRLEPDFDDIESALDYGKSKGFDFTVFDQNREAVASWSIIGGVKRISQ